MSPDDIRDIRPLLAIPPIWPWALVGALTLGLVVLLVLGVRAWRKRARKPLTPEEQATAALARAEALARAGQCHEWGEVVAATLRSALASRLGQAACPQTTSELAKFDWARVQKTAAVDVNALIALLSTCDLTRFALARLEPNALLSETQAARDWVGRLFAPPRPDVSPTAEAAP